MNLQTKDVTDARWPRNWKLCLAYDGTDFQGWQVQPEQRTVQGELAKAIERITGERTLPQGSGRTDAGVHALGQVASVALRAPIPEANLLRALNRALPGTIRVLSAEVVPDAFHARHSAVRKTYQYRIFRGDICPPSLARYVYALPWPLNEAAMNEAAALVAGEHDFSSFAACDPDVRRRTTGIEENNVRTLWESRWFAEPTEAGPEPLLIYQVTGSGFLHHMVRNLVGTFLDVGRGRPAAAKILEILRARSRSAAGPTAPARGLFLMGVGYPDPLPVDGVAEE